MTVTTKTQGEDTTISITMAADPVEGYVEIWANVIARNGIRLLEYLFNADPVDPQRALVAGSGPNELLLKLSEADTAAMQPGLYLIEIWTEVAGTPNITSLFQQQQLELLPSITKGSHIS